MNKPRIIAVHLLNDYSGSPLVFRNSLLALQHCGYTIELYTSSATAEGFLSNIKNIVYKEVKYQWSENKLHTLFHYLLNQFRLFVNLLFRASRKDIVYVNSLLPFGAALAGWLRGAKVVYHVHEVSIKPDLLKKWLLWVMNLTASRGIFVSAFLSNNTPFHKNAAIVYNSVHEDFILQASRSARQKNPVFSVLMICSLKKYKGVYEFVQLATLLPQFRFVLVLNAGETAIKQFFQDTRLPANLQLQPATSNVHPFYANTHLTLNLSYANAWVETFGMTILESMLYGNPVIVPCTGGITELVEEGYHGYRIDSGEINTLTERIKALASDTELYQRLSKNALLKAGEFGPVAFISKLTAVFSDIELKNIKTHKTKAACAA